MKNSVRGDSRAATLFVGLLLLAGCQTPAPVPPPDTQIASLDLFMTRSSLLSTDFEQYSLSDDGLFSECGIIDHGRFVAKTQILSDLSSEERAAIVESAYGLQQMLGEKKPSFDPPGTKASPFDPGSFSLKISLGGEEIDVKTSFDAVVNGENRPTEKLRTLTKLLRYSAAEGCGANTFYGLRGTKR